jgi:hypothetical protein
MEIGFKAMALLAAETLWMGIKGRMNVRKIEEMNWSFFMATSRVHHTNNVLERQWSISTSWMKERPPMKKAVLYCTFGYQGLLRQVILDEERRSQTDR